MVGARRGPWRGGGGPPGVVRKGGAPFGAVSGGPIGVLVMAYGGPDSLDDVEPYLLDVRGGRALSDEIIEEMTERYRLIGGRSPILERTQAQSDRLQEALNSSSDGATFHCYVGMRHWTPRIETALSSMSQAGISRAVGVVMAPHYSRMSIGAYFKKIADQNSPVEFASIDRWHLLPELVETLAERVVATLREFDSEIQGDVQLLFTAHSLPERILEWDDPYPTELRETMEAVIERLRPPTGIIGNPYDFAYQSAAMTQDSWLGPDAGEVIQRLHAQGCPGALLVPIGFTSDHVEVLYDIDVQYAKLADDLGFQLRRIPMLNDDPRTMAGLADLVRQRAKERDWNA